VIRTDDARVTITDVEFHVEQPEATRFYAYATGFIDGTQSQRDIRLGFGYDSPWLPQLLDCFTAGVFNVIVSGGIESQLIPKEGRSRLLIDVDFLSFQT
jgi:hypothetical protein